ncbi:transmembrane protein 119 [Tachysurus fulvidraco]|uniref:transmembrane protein 119 n=1 Tax=Tachysurus fulvidraco TaxID=1234273 RepID=UPI000F4DEE89|nr:transmembrane protein 119 [Tachysurus fulvidraco]
MSSMCPRLAFVLLFAFSGWNCSTTAFPFNTSVESSGDEPELIFPISHATHLPPPSPTPILSITTTFIRIKHFLFHEVVDFLRDNMLLIIVVMSLLIVIIFIACCASAMSHKRKLEAYYPPKKHAPRKYMAVPSKGVEQSLLVPNNVTTSYLRAPSKALVGEKGKDPRPKPKEVQKAEDVEEVEVQKEEEKKKEEPKPSTSTAGNGQVLVCTCHLRKANQASQ